MSIPIVIVCGKSKSGKDALTSSLIRQFGGVSLALADPIKALMQQFFGLPDDVWWGSSEDRNVEYKTKNINTVPDTLPYNGHRLNLKQWRKQFEETFTPRKALQTFGTEVVRAVDPNLWINLGLKNAKTLLTGGYFYDKVYGVVPADHSRPPGLVVISDGRFRNEIIEARSIGATAIKVSRPGVQSNTNKAGVPGHSSEIEIENIPGHFFDVLVNNDQGLEELEKKAYVIGTQILHLDKQQYVL